MYKRAVVGDSFDSSRSFRFQCFCLVFLLFELFKQHIQLVGNVIVVAEAVVKERRADGKAPGLHGLDEVQARVVSNASRDDHRGRNLPSELHGHHFGIAVAVAIDR